MKKILLLFIFISGSSFSQETREEWHNLYLEKVKSYREDFNRIEKVERIISAINELRPTYNKILEMENPSVNVQKALVKDYASKYQDLFYKDEQKKENYLKVGLGKENYKKYLDLLESIMEIKAVKSINEIYIEYYDLKAAYIDQNLKRLNITRAEFDAMSEKDQQTLINTFKQ